MLSLFITPLKDQGLYEKFMPRKELLKEYEFQEYF